MIFPLFSKLIQSRSGIEKWTAVLGSEDRSQRMISLPIEQIFVHPNFVDYQNDIGKVHFTVTNVKSWHLQVQVVLISGVALAFKFHGAKSLKVTKIRVKIWVLAASLVQNL